MSGFLDKAMAELMDRPDLPQIHLKWSEIGSKIHDRAVQQRPKPKSFEVHHQTVKAREVFLQSLMDGMTIEDAAQAALGAIGF